ncbi:hypothetical protein [Gordonia aurantiaca]|uniref:hypothetical protein n=1 Tax=Gordonia sp. B21 TaxID=3151852 RepID=UPI003265BF13
MQACELTGCHLGDRTPRSLPGSGITAGNRKRTRRSCPPPWQVAVWTHLTELLHTCPAHPLGDLIPLDAVFGIWLENRYDPQAAVHLLSEDEYRALFYFDLLRRVVRVVEYDNTVTGHLHAIQPDPRAPRCALRPRIDPDNRFVLWSHSWGGADDHRVGLYLTSVSMPSDDPAAIARTEAYIAYGARVLTRFRALVDAHFNSYEGLHLNTSGIWTPRVRRTGSR